MTTNVLAVNDANATLELQPALAIELLAVSKSYGELKALDELSLRIRPGEIYGLLGPNGAGKSTTINILCGLLRPDSGVVRIAGFDTSASSKQAKSKLGLVPQELALYTELSSRQNLAFFGRLCGMSGKNLTARIDTLLHLMELDGRDREPVSQLSGGMQRRLNIAAALVHQPPVILMDEPTVGVDPQNRIKILDLVTAVAASGATVLYSTHYMDEVEKICGRIGIIDHGRLLAEGTADELRSRSGGLNAVTFRGSFQHAKAQAITSFAPGERIVISTASEIVIEMKDVATRLSPVLAAVSEAGEVREISISRQSLESLFIQVTGRELRE